MYMYTCVHAYISACVHICAYIQTNILTYLCICDCLCDDDIITAESETAWDLGYVTQGKVSLKNERGKIGNGGGGMDILNKNLVWHKTPPPSPHLLLGKVPISPIFLMTPPSSCCLLGLMSLKTCNYSRVHCVVVVVSKRYFGK